MKCLNPSILFALIFTFFFGIEICAQISEKSIPPSIQQKIINADFPEIQIQSPDVQRLLDEDAFTDKHGIAMRFAISTPVNIDLAKTGRWMPLDDGSKICRLAVTSPKAQALIMYYSEFRIPDHGKLFLYNESKHQSIGAFTDVNNRNGGAFATEMIFGETTILEYVQPAGHTDIPAIVIGEVGYVYRTAERIFGDRGFGGSDFCEVNVKCPEGDNWQDQEKGVARIIVKQGTSSVWCTGSLLNNARQNHTPYFFTADHCGPNATPSDYDSWIFYFRYQSDSCGNPSNDTAFNSYTMVGAGKIAAAGGAGVESDFKLLLLNDTVPQSYNPSFNGWSAVNESSPSGVTIHHPQGDIKKISTYTEPLISSNWASIPNTHWKVVWAETETNHGVTEGGSSGSPIFNDNGLVVGQLTGGDAGCSYLTGPDYYGKFSYSWDQIGSSPDTQLKPWLDPDDTGIVQLGNLVATVNLPKTDYNINVFPNPTNGPTNIDFGNDIPFGDVDISVVDITGRKVFEKSATPMDSGVIELNLTSLEKGVYFIMLNYGSTKNSVIKIIR